MKTATDFSLHEQPADTFDARTLLAAYFAELAVRLGGFDPGVGGEAAGVDEMLPPTGAFVVGYEDGRAVACGGLRRFGEGVGEIKRMYVAPEARGRGYARRLLAQLEACARDRGCSRIVLDSTAPLVEAIALYAASGYRAVPAYNDNPNATHWFEKSLG